VIRRGLIVATPSQWFGVSLAAWQLAYGGSPSPGRRTPDAVTMFTDTFYSIQRGGDLQLGCGCG
jgi:hypothetical protein